MVFIAQAERDNQDTNLQFCSHGVAKLGSVGFVEKIDDTFKGFTFRGVDRSADDEHRCFRLDRVVSYYYLDKYKKPYIVVVKTFGYWLDEYEVEAESEELAEEEYFENGGYKLNDDPMAFKDYEHEITSVRPDFIEEDWD